MVSKTNKEKKTNVESEASKDSDVSVREKEQVNLIISKLIPIAIAIAVIVLSCFTVLLLNPSSRQKQMPYIQTITPTPTPSNSSYIFIDNLEDALKHPSEAKLLYHLCGKKLSSIPPSVGGLTRTEYLDLSENNLSTLPNEISMLSSLKELALIDNNFSSDEQVRIKQLLPNTEIAFIPQKNFNPYLAENWKNYINTKYDFSFKYHPDLMVLETAEGAAIKNELADFKYAYLSCVAQKEYINLIVAVKDNPNNFTPIQYIEDLWNIKINQDGDKYTVDKSSRNYNYIRPVKKYKNGDIDGIIADYGESEHPSIVAVHNNKIYIFQYLPGGETGSTIGDTPKAVLNQSLATFKFINL